MSEENKETASAEPPSANEVQLPWKRLVWPLLESDAWVLEGKHYSVPESQAIALYRGAKMILEIEEGNKSGKYNTIEERVIMLSAIELLHKGVKE